MAATPRENVWIWLALASWLILSFTPSCKRREQAAKKHAAASVSRAAAKRPTLDRAKLRTKDGRERSYYVYVPSRLDKATKHPVLLVLHGGGGTADGARTTTFTQGAADRHRLITVYPEGLVHEVGGKPTATWNGGYCCGKAKEEGVDDTAFLVELLDELAKSYPVDLRRIYATGISNGGILAMRLACEHPDRVAAISTVGAPGYIAGCSEAKPTAVQIIHGQADGCAPYEGGARCGGCWEQVTSRLLGIEVPAQHFACTGVKEQAAFWRNVNGCTERSHTTYDRGDAKCVEYDDCSTKQNVSVCTIEDGGHTWPGAVRGCDESKPGCRAFAEVSGKISADMDANAVMADFLRRFKRQR